METEEIKKIVASMTLDEKISLTVGKNTWETYDIERLGIPSIWMSDGPHGIRKGPDGNDNDLNCSIAAVSFPAECLVAASFDRELVRELGRELGKECQARNVNLLLGPGINMKRSPLCGRNFEYMSEDPYHAGEMACAYIDGIQSEGVGACVKHFFANNQETRRFTNSSDISERAIREIYLAAFERVIKKSNPWAVMCSYNKVNSVQNSENKQYLKDVLRDEWEYDGCVISDWGATHNRARAVKGGTNLTMPYESTDEVLKEAVEKGDVSIEDIDDACVNILRLVYRGVEHIADNAVNDMKAGHNVARNVAAQSAVLLKNSDNLLPLNTDKKIAFIGGFCKEPRFQGGGSSHVTVSRLSTPYHEAKKRCDIIYSPGYKKDGTTTEELIEHAKLTAREASVSVLFVGLPESYEYEGGDRKNIKLPEGHNRLIEAVCSVSKNVAVVLYNGSAVEIPWVNGPKAILEMYLPGEAVGEATCDVLFGDVNPSGRLPETFPVKLSDTPSYLNFPGNLERTFYAEDVYIGYRYYATKHMPVRFPFGYGLSYTTFKYSDFSVDVPENVFENKDDIIKVSVNVTNTGNRTGKEVVQLYVAVKDCEVMRPVCELKGFEKISLEPGETGNVTFELDRRAFAYWNEDPEKKHTGYFRVPSGKYSIRIGKSSMEFDMAYDISVKGEDDKFKHCLKDDDYASGFLAFDYGKKYLEERRSIIEEAAGTSMEEYLDAHHISELRCLTPKLGWMEWNQVLDVCNGNFEWSLGHD